VVKELDSDDDDHEGDIVPKTDIRPNHAKDELENNWEALNAQLTFESMQQKEQDRVKLHEISIGEYRGDDHDKDGARKRGAPEATSPEDSKKKNFADKRAAHYNEVKNLVELFLKHCSHSTPANSQSCFFKYLTVFGAESDETKADGRRR
jgi:hypothetical protein